MQWMQWMQSFESTKNNNTNHCTKLAFDNMEIDISDGLFVGILFVVETVETNCIRSKFINKMMNSTKYARFFRRYGSVDK